MPRILVVDDSPTILKVVSAILARSGLDSRTARDGIVGLKLLAEEGPFDLILLDFVMPRMNGYQFCRELRKDPSLKSLPIVLMSAKGDRIRAQFVQQTGAVDAITKPFDARTLVAVVDGVLAKMKAGKGPALPEGEAMPEEESLGEDSEPRPSVLPRQLEQRAVLQIIQHVNRAVTPVIAEMKDAERGKPEALGRAIARAIEASPLDSLLLSLRELASTAMREVLSGDLAFVQLPEVLQMLQMQRQTGVMRVVSGKRSANVYLRDGALDLACATGENEEFKLGRYFVEMGVLKRADVDGAVQEAMKRGVRLGDQLVDSQKASDAERRQALVKQSSEVLYDIVRWPHGRFWFGRDPHSSEAEHAKLGLAMAPLVLEGFRRVDEWRAMEKTIAWDDVVVVDEAALEQVGEKLEKAERKLLAVIDGRKNVNQIVDDSELPRFDALKIVYQLLSSRVLRSIQRARPSEMTSRAPQPSSQSSEASPPGASSPAAHGTAPKSSELSFGDPMSTTEGSLDE